MSLKSWRDVITPHEDVLEGTFLASEFAADLTKVIRGKATPEYQNPVRFFERTVITEGMRLLLRSVAQRLSGKGGDPVVQLQTSFGGGKTHTMMAVLHMARGEVSPSQMVGIPQILDEASVGELHRGNVAVLDGNALSPSEPREHDGVTANTLWGEMAYQLGGTEGYAMVENADRDGTSPGKETLANLFERFSPCVVLMDETVAYLRQFRAGKSYRGGTFDSNLSFIQALTEGASTVPTAMVLASLPESKIELGDARGAEALASLQKYFGRIEAVWKPVATDEAFEIVRRRLFGAVSDGEGCEATCRAFAQLYVEHSEAFPAEAREAAYLARLKSSYPIHPEVFDRLYEDWSTLPRFQRTRGVLRLMARIIHVLWRGDNRDALILPASIPLDDVEVRTELVKYLDGTWEPIVEKDVDGISAQPRRIDDEVPNLGSLQACRRAARTVFLGSAPSVREQRVRGISTERVHLGCVQPGQSPGRYDDALHRLSGRLHHLYQGNERYWFDLRPNLRREMEERMRRFDTGADVHPEIQRRLSKAIGKGIFQAIHVFLDHQHIKDDEDLRLIVLDPDAVHRRRDEGSPAVNKAKEILERRGEDARSHQNRLLFLAIDNNQLLPLRDQTRRYLAWDSICKAVDELNLDRHHQKQAETNRRKAGATLDKLLRDAYAHLLVPVQEVEPGGEIGEVFWEDGVLPSGEANFASAIQKLALEQEWVIAKWAPKLFVACLEAFYWTDDATDASALRVWQDSTKYLYLPRLTRRVVFETTLTDGALHRDYFGVAHGKSDEGGYEGLLFGRTGNIYLGDGTLIVTPASASLDPGRKADLTEEAGGTKGDASNNNGDDDGPYEPIESQGEPGPQRATRFFASIELDPQGATLLFDDIAENIIQPLLIKLGTTVMINVDIRATNSKGFDEAIQRTVKENAATLKFQSASFEEE
ncbi:MAG: DUF499 domain-containing protein [Myxococcota bacterium]